MVRREPGLEAGALEFSYKNMKGYSTKAAVRSPNAAPLLWRPIPEQRIHNQNEDGPCECEGGSSCGAFVTTGLPPYNAVE